MIVFLFALFGWPTISAGILELRDESIRVHTQATLISRTCTQDSFIANTPISKCTKFFVPIGPFHKHQGYFPDLVKLELERFFEENKDSLSKHTFLPFGEGPRIRFGENCSPLGGGEGICRLLTKCDTLGDFKNNHPPICNFNGKDWEPIICCPTKKGPIVESGRKVKRICAELEDTHIYNAYLPVTIKGFEPPIEVKPNKTGPSFSVGGTEVTGRGHPYMALIGFCGTEKTYCDESEVTWGCGGSIITPRYVLSAAHCGYTFGLGPARWARLGDLDISSSIDDAMPVNKTIVDIIIYPEYKDHQVYHDIALFKLDSKVQFNGFVLPVCLQTESHIQQKKANFTGWGRTGFAEATSNKLLEGEIDIYNDTECKRLKFSSFNSKSPDGYQPHLMFCAGIPDGSRDTCTGDSGGPLVTFGTIRKKRAHGTHGSGLYRPHKVQIGITSYGNNCGLPDSPGVYTRVSNYIPWIEEVAFKDVTVLD